MRQVVFAHPRHIYDSYTDYRALSKLDFETCFYNEIDLSREAVYIVSPFNGELPPAVAYQKSIVPEKDRKARVVYWNLERPDHPGFMKEPGEPMERVMARVVDECLAVVDFVWISDRSLAKLDPRLIYVIMGSNKALAEAAGRPYEWDLCHMSYVHGRRDDMVRKLEAAGLNIGPNGFGEARAKVLSASRMMVNIHQREPLRPYAPLRFNLAAAYGLPIVTETLDDPYPLVPGQSVFMADFGAPLVELVRDLVKNRTEELAFAGAHARRILCDIFPFRVEVENGLRRTLFDE